MDARTKVTLMRIINRRTVGALIAGTAAVLAVAVLAGPADAAVLRRPVPAPVATATPAPAPGPASGSIAVTGTDTRLGVNFSAGGYALVTYSVRTTSTGVYAVRYAVDVAGSAINTSIDGVPLKQVSVGAGAPITTSTFVLTAGVHTIGTQSPDGYGSTSIDLVRVG